MTLEENQYGGALVRSARSYGYGAFSADLQCPQGLSELPEPVFLAHAVALLPGKGRKAGDVLAGASGQMSPNPPFFDQQEPV